MWCSNKQTPNLLAFLPSFTHLPANKRTQCHVGSELTHEQGFSRSETPHFCRIFLQLLPSLKGYYLRLGSPGSQFLSTLGEALQGMQSTQTQLWHQLSIFFHANKTSSH